MKKILNTVITKFYLFLDRLLYRSRDFVVISNNCWGAEIYKSLGLEYNTPFVGLFIYGPDYIKLLQNFDLYMNSKLTFADKSKWLDSAVSYPVGTLQDVEIHFLHYKNAEEALSKWNRRTNRMLKTTDKDKYYYKICDRDSGNKNDNLVKFHELPFKNKISFGINGLNNISHIQVRENENNQTVPDGVKLYRYSYKYVDVLNWINSGTIKTNLYSKIKSALLVRM